MNLGTNPITELFLGGSPIKSVWLGTTKVWEHTYDYEIKGKTTPKVGDIIRMYSPDGSKKVCNATRVKVLAVKSFSEKSESEISYVESSLEEPSISKKKT